MADFRALRAIVLRGRQQNSPADAAAFRETVRFNEAIDQALAESVRVYAQQTARMRGSLYSGAGA
jgi:hypothetical protein